MAERAYERHAWIVLFAVGVITALFGVGDIVSATAADPAIVESITGLKPREIGEADPRILALIDYQVRLGGAALLILGFLAAVIAWTSFRRGERWAWYALWALPGLSILIFALLYAAVDFSLGVLPPPLVSAPAFLAITVMGLLLPLRRFFPKER